MDAMELEITPAFPTLIAQLRVPDAEAMNQDLQALILAEEAKYLSLGRSNIGGWHSRPDFLSRPELSVGALTAWITWAVRRMVDATAGPGAFKGTLFASAWATICRAGAYHAPHSHPDSAWSGVYYVDAGAANPDRPLSGVLEFLDPRAGVEAVSAPGDPYGEPVQVRPESGLLVVFPSWLYHWVHPYVGQSPRIAVSFNAALGALDSTKTGIAEAIASGEIETSTAPRCGSNGSRLAVTTTELGPTRRSDAISTCNCLKGGHSC
jgi:uncharacterized protein (TIGR02466 family)